MSDAECGRKLYTDMLAYFRHLVAGISQADPFERKAPEPAGGLSFDPCINIYIYIYAILHILEVADLSRIQNPH